jgi:hypothetical protein
MTLWQQDSIGGKAMKLLRGMGISAAVAAMGMAADAPVTFNAGDL